MLLQFPRFVAASGQPQQLLPALFLRSGRGSLLPSLAECQLPGGQHVRILQGRSLFAVKSRSEDDWSAPGFIDPHHCRLF